MLSAPVHRCTRRVKLTRVLCLFVWGCGLTIVGAGPAAAQEQELAPENDTSEEAISRLERSLIRSKWNLGKGDWQQFLPEMKTTNKANRIGNWVVTDDQTIITGGRGSTGSLYVWKLDARKGNAAISKYVLDVKYERSASLTSQLSESEEETGVAHFRQLLTASKWDLGSGDWQQFLPELKTTNKLNRTGNWVVTDVNTVLTGGRGSQGAIYIWKFDKKLSKAVITKYVRDPKYARSASRMR